MVPLLKLIQSPHSQSERLIFDRSDLVENFNQKLKEHLQGRLSEGEFIKHSVAFCETWIEAVDSNFSPKHLVELRVIISLFEQALLQAHLNIFERMPLETRFKRELISHLSLPWAAKMEFEFTELKEIHDPEKKVIATHHWVRQFFQVVGHFSKIEGFSMKSNFYVKKFTLLIKARLLPGAEKSLKELVRQGLEFERASTPFSSRIAIIHGLNKP
jgi:hypothetical protein